MSNLSEMYYATFDRKSVVLYNGYKQIIRKYNMQADVVNAQVSGSGKNAYVAIVTKDGHNYLYNSDGQMIRKG